MSREMPWVLVLVILAALTPAQATAASNPALTGQIAGSELCPQFICGSAIFSGALLGAVNTVPANASFLASITHQSPLPTQAGQFVLITGGSWLIWTHLGPFFGTIDHGGTVTNNGNNTFAVIATLTLLVGGTGTIHFSGTLDHNVFPPIIIGAISQ